MYEIIWGGVSAVPERLGNTGLGNEAKHFRR
jgi:hypothetical protein